MKEYRHERVHDRWGGIEIARIGSVWIGRDGRFSAMAENPQITHPRFCGKCLTHVKYFEEEGSVPI